MTTTITKIHPTTHITIVIVITMIVTAAAATIATAPTPFVTVRIAHDQFQVPRAVGYVTRETQLRLCSAGRARRGAC